MTDIEHTINITNYISKESDLKAPFSTDTTLKCKEESYSLPWIAPLTFDSYIMLRVKQRGIKYHFFKVFGMTQLGIEPWSPGPLANT